ncbi:hypothetical protein KY346_05980 [Candidatus Woesearchaeota archaeon]|nr:hypothetical protein [Candidatus Woesearchaeota archaeon]
MRIKKFAPEEHFEAASFFNPKRIRIDDETDIDEAFIEEDILEEVQPWERAFELGTQMANDEMSDL